MSYTPACAATRKALESALASPSSVDVSWAPQSDFALARDELSLLGSLVNQLLPHHVLELGSGVSTDLFMRVCADLPHPCAVTSIDHDPEFAWRAGTLLVELNERDCRVRRQIAPLVARDLGGKKVPLYCLDREHFSSTLPADLILIDAPPFPLGGREGALYQVMDFAREGTLIIADDVNPPWTEPRTQVPLWVENLGDAIEVIELDEFTNGLAAIIVRKPVPLSDLWTHQLKLNREDLAAVVPPGADFTVLDPSSWDLTELGDRRYVPFLDRQGVYCGPPASDADAIRELELLRHGGVGFLGAARADFWWFEYYTDFGDYLSTNFPSLLRNDRVAVFDLQHPVSDVVLTSNRDGAQEPAATHPGPF